MLLPVSKTEWHGRSNIVVALSHGLIFAIRVYILDCIMPGTRLEFYFPLLKGRKKRDNKGRKRFLQLINADQGKLSKINNPKNIIIPGSSVPSAAFAISLFILLE